MRDVPLLGKQGLGSWRLERARRESEVGTDDVTSRWAPGRCSPRAANDVTSHGRLADGSV